MEAPVTGPSYLNPTEENAKLALIEAHGDVFVASQILGISALRLDRAIRVSEVLRSTLDSILQLKNERKGSALSDEEIHEAVERRVAIYRVVGLDALHDLAAMPISENSAQNQVKLAAGVRLAGESAGGGFAGGLGETFKELADLYQQNAPRLRVIRERTTVELAPPSERVIEGQATKE